MMSSGKETLIRELHKRLIEKFMDRINRSIGSIQISVVEGKSQETDAPKEEADSPDLINEMRNKVTHAQSLEILSPDKQNELLQMMKQGYEEFEHELQRIVSQQDSRAESAMQKFKLELLTHTKNQLAEKRHAFDC